MIQMVEDARYAARGFLRNPVFSVTAILTLALGIGATTSVFSVVDRILFRALPYRAPDRIVVVGLVHSLEQQEFLMGRFYYDWLDHQQPFEAIAVQGAMAHPCDLVELNPAQLHCLTFGSGLLPLLGVSPIRGHNFSSDEDRPHGPRVAMISYDLWHGHYNEDPHIIGRSINIDGSEARITAVLPKTFQFPATQTADVIFPMALDRAEQQNANGGLGRPMRAFARLKKGVNLDQANAEMQSLFNSERLWLPAEGRDDVRVSIRSLHESKIAEVRSTAWILLGSVLAVLMIACANVASLLTARGASREPELALRAALGARRSRLARLALTESVLLSLCGAVVGIVIAELLLRIFLGLAPSNIPLVNVARIDLRILIVTFSLSLFCGCAFGLQAAFRKPRTVLLKSRFSKGYAHLAMRRLLVIGQIAISMVLLTGAALLFRSFWNIQRQELGMEITRVSAVHVALPSFRYNNGQKKMDYFLRLESTLRHFPGVDAVGICDSIPPGGLQDGFRYSDLEIEGASVLARKAGTFASRSVTPDYFRALSISVIRGRRFSEADRTASQQTVIISSSLAELLSGVGDPVGRTITIKQSGDSFTIVGVASNVKNGGLVEPDVPEIYFLRRNIASDWNGHSPELVLSSVLPVAAIHSWIRKQVALIDPTVPVQIESLDQVIRKMEAQPRFETSLLGFFALTGLIMAMIGTYGVIAHITAERTQEFGIRMALGATNSDIFRLVAWNSVRLIGSGVVLGSLVSYGVSRLLQNALYRVNPHDPLSFFAVFVLLTGVAASASIAPARAAMRIQPVEVLRYE